MIHFTCEDQYLEHPYWPDDDILKENVYMIHIWHNKDFTEVKMSARWTDPLNVNYEIKNIEKQSITIGGMLLFN